MRLNRKGYMLVEIIVASVLAMSIAYYLLNLTYKFKNTNDDIYQSYFYMQDKLLITKNIMSDLDNGFITEIVEYDYTAEDGVGKAIEFSLYRSSVDYSKRKLLVTKKDGVTKIRYGKIQVNEEGIYVFDKNDISYYEKDLEKTLMVEDLIKEEGSGLLTFTISVTSIYSDTDYSIKLVANRLCLLDLSFNIGGEFYYGGYPADPAEKELKIGLEINGESIGEDGYKADLCGYYPYGSSVKISTIQYQGTIVDTHEEEFELTSDTYMMIYLTDNTTFQFVKRENLPYRTEDGTCLGLYEET